MQKRAATALAWKRKAIQQSAPCGLLEVVGRLAWTGDARRGARAQAPLARKMISLSWGLGVSGYWGVCLDSGGCKKPRRDRAGRRRKWRGGNGPCDGAGLVEVWADQL